MRWLLRILTGALIVVFLVLAFMVGTFVERMV